MITGTPWHVSTGDLAKDERRHRARCIHYNKEEKFCYYRSSNCVGAGQCPAYSEEERLIWGVFSKKSFETKNSLYKITIKTSKADKEIVDWFVENFPYFKKDIGFYIQMFPTYEQLKSLAKLVEKKYKFIDDFNLLIDGINDSISQTDRYLLEFDLDRVIDVLNGENDYVFKVNIHNKSVQYINIAEIINEGLTNQNLSEFYHSFNVATKISEDLKDSLEKCMKEISGKESYKFRELKTIIRGAIRNTSTKTIFFDLKKFLFLHECLFC